MANEQLANYIKSQLSKSVPLAQIRNTLLAQGWSESHIREAFHIATQPTIHTNPSRSTKKPINFLPIMIAIVVILVITGIIFFATQDKSSPDILMGSEKQESESLSQEVLLDANCDAFPDKLDACTRYKCEFEHPFNGELMEKEILGIVDGKCNYVEEMPNNGKMECKYTESLRRAVAQYYQDITDAETYTTEVHMDPESVVTRYTIDGKEVENPLQEALNNGQCVISGY